MSIDVSVENNIATITINRPERLNAMDAEHYQGLSAAWTRVRDDTSIRVAIVTGAGERSFSTGADIKSFLTAPLELREMWLTQREQLLNRGLEVWKPIIAAVNGYCLAGGMTLLLATDIRIAAEHATFGVAEVKRGIIPGNGGTQRILEQLPYAIAMELLLTGDPIDAATAARFGLVNKVVPKDQLMPAALAMAQKIAANAPLAVQGIKRTINYRAEQGLAEALRFEAASASPMFVSDDMTLGYQAMAEKRDADFEGK